MRLSDEQIIEGLRNRNNDTVQYVYDHYFRMCRYIVTSNKGSDEDSKDMFQESLLILIEKVRKYDFKLSSQFQTFLFAIISNLWSKELLYRRNAENFAERQVDIDLHYLKIIEAYDKQLSSSLLWKCFKRLEKECQTILNLWWKGFTQIEIAEVLSFKYGYIRKLKMNCDESLTCIIKDNSELMDVFTENPAMISQTSYA
ncbi:MAG: sigma-70 family RNA polymerase sigma factor [Bacteroidales bacterium]|nr:sigma-70 family RNA polymerase sigma factor [Bacteroidales bacterium]MCF8391994.1 sigma-70 family RNA polymerase sigma factor [Bacteroidales bacterium]